MAAQHTVVLLHGIWRSRWSMALLARHLRREGYRVIDPSYPSTRFPLETLVEQLHDRLSPLLGSGTTHFVGHSMGGLLIRAYLAKYPPQALGRVVMLGTPNHGSEIADAIGHWPLYRWLFGPAGQQLGTRTPRGEVLPVCELGVIAGTVSYDPFFDRHLPLPHDGKVSVESTKLPGMHAHLVLPTSHDGMLLSPRVWREVALFLREGRFSGA